MARETYLGKKIPVLTNNRTVKPVSFLICVYNKNSVAYLMLFSVVGHRAVSVLLESDCAPSKKG